MRTRRGFQSYRERWPFIMLRCKAIWAEGKGDHQAALSFLRQAAQIRPLHPENRADEARLLLVTQRFREAQNALASLRADLSQSSDPDRLYLRRWSTAQIALMQTNPSQFAYEAREAQALSCRRRLKEKFPLPVPEED